MNDQCTQCRFRFTESSIQASRRERHQLPVLCQECYRLNMAESRANKRSMLENLTEKQPTFDQMLENLTYMHGQLSPSLLMKKLKISYELAQELCLSKIK